MATRIEDIVIELVMMSADRAAIVKPDAPKGLIVMMLSARARCTLGAELHEKVLTPMGNSMAPHEPDVTLKTPIAEVFGIGEATPRGWFCFDVELGDVKAVGFVVSGTWCDAAAEICNRNGAPVSWDAKANPPGYEVEKVIDRGDRENVRTKRSGGAE